MVALVYNNIETIKTLCQQHHVKPLYVLGSAVNGDFGDNSDIDLLYEFDYTGFDFNDLKNAPFDPFLIFFDVKDLLENLFKRKIDLIPYQHFRNKYFREEVERTKQLIYAVTLAA